MKRAYQILRQKEVVNVELHLSLLKNILKQMKRAITNFDTHRND